MLQAVPLKSTGQPAFVLRRRFEFAGALALAAFLPWAFEPLVHHRHHVRPRCLHRLAGRQYRRDLLVAVGADVGRNLSRDPRRAGDPAGGDRGACGGVRHPADAALPLSPAVTGRGLRAASAVGLRNLFLRRAAAAPENRDRPVRRGRAAAADRHGRMAHVERARSRPASRLQRDRRRFHPICPTNGRRSWPTPRSTGGWSTKSSNCSNR